MVIKRLLLLFFLVSFTVRAQNTNVSGAVTDGGGQTWNNGTYSFNFFPSPTWNGVYKQNGVTFNSVPINGSLSATGTFTSVPVPDNAQITPSGTKWTITVCAQTNFVCFTSLPITITGASQTITSSINPAAILVTCGPGVNAYADAEVSCGVGGQYYNLTSSTSRQCTTVVANACTVWQAAGGGISSPTPKNIIDVTLPPYNVINDAKWVLDATYNTAATACGSGTVPAGTCIVITATDPPFVAGDVGKYEFGTYDCIGGNPAQCLRAVPDGTIVAVFDGQHAQVSSAALHNSVVSTGSNFTWYSTGNNAKLQSATSFILSNPGTALQLPCGGTVAGSTGGSGAIGLDTTGAPFIIPQHTFPIAIRGCPGGGTVIISPPAMNCGGGGAACLLQSTFTLGQSISNIGSEDVFENLFFTGLGLDVNIGSFGGHSIVSITGPAQVINVNVNSYLWNVATSYVINGLLCTSCQTINSGAYGGGNFPCAFAGSIFSSSSHGGVCGGSAGTGMTPTANNTGELIIDGMYLYNGINNGFYGVDGTFGTNANVVIKSSYIGSIHLTAGSLSLEGDFVDRGQPGGNSPVLQSGGVLTVKDTFFNNSGVNFLNISAGTFSDLGGNRGENAVTQTGGIVTGITNSATGTLCATGNFAFTSGWGTSSVTSVVANGNIQGCHVTITGAAGSASPVLTWTYPAAVPLAPASCHLSGGAQGTLTGVGTGTPGATTVAFTFTGTPSAQTYNFDVGCP